MKGVRKEKNAKRRRRNAKKGISKVDVYRKSKNAVQ